MPDLPPIDWTTVKPAHGSSRHYTGPGLGQTGPWTCPSCGAKNTGALEDGCPNCRERQTAQHIGVDPPVRRREPAPIAASDFNIEQAFEQFLRAERIVNGTEQNVARRAFFAGVAYVRRHTPAEPREPADPLPLTGTKESRTIIAALKFFREQILSLTPEEVHTGEWLSASEVDAYLTHLEETVPA